MFLLELLFHQTCLWMFDTSLSTKISRYIILLPMMYQDISLSLLPRKKKSYQLNWYTINFGDVKMWKKKKCFRINWLLLHKAFDPEFWTKLSSRRIVTMQVGHESHVTQPSLSTRVIFTKLFFKENHLSFVPNRN